MACIVSSGASRIMAIASALLILLLAPSAFVVCRSAIPFLTALDGIEKRGGRPQLRGQPEFAVRTSDEGSSFPIFFDIRLDKRSNHHHPRNSLVQADQVLVPFCDATQQLLPKCSIIPQALRVFGITNAKWKAEGYPRCSFAAPIIHNHGDDTILLQLKVVQQIRIGPEGFEKGRGFEVCTQILEEDGSLDLLKHLLRDQPSFASMTRVTVKVGNCSIEPTLRAERSLVGTSASQKASQRNLAEVTSKSKEWQTEPSDDASGYDRTPAIEEENLDAYATIPPDNSSGKARTAPPLPTPEPDLFQKSRSTNYIDFPSNDTILPTPAPTNTATVMNTSGRDTGMLFAVGGIAVAMVASCIGVVFCLCSREKEEHVTNRLASTSAANTSHVPPGIIALNKDNQSLADTSIGDRTAGRKRRSKKKVTLAAASVGSFDDSSLYTTPFSADGVTSFRPTASISVAPSAASSSMNLYPPTRETPATRQPDGYPFPISYQSTILFPIADSAEPRERIRKIGPISVDAGPVDLDADDESSLQSDDDDFEADFSGLQTKPYLEQQNSSFGDDWSDAFDSHHEKENEDGAFSFASRSTRPISNALPPPPSFPTSFVKPKSTFEPARPVISARRKIPPSNSDRRMEPSTLKRVVPLRLPLPKGAPKRGTSRNPPKPTKKVQFRLPPPPHDTAENKEIFGDNTSAEPSLSSWSMPSKQTFSSVKSESTWPSQDSQTTELGQPSELGRRLGRLRSHKSTKVEHVGVDVEDDFFAYESMRLKERQPQRKSKSEGFMMSTLIEDEDINSDDDMGLDHYQIKTRSIDDHEESIEIQKVDDASESSVSTGMSLSPWLYDTVEETLGPRSILADLESLSARSNISTRSTKSSVVSYGSRVSYRSASRASSTSDFAPRTLEHDLKRLGMQLAAYSRGDAASSVTNPSNVGASLSTTGIPSSRRRTTDTASPAIKKRLVLAPPGRLGVILANRHDGNGIVVSEVRNNSVLAGKIFPGEKLLAVDDDDISGMLVSQITSLMAAKSKQERRLTIASEQILQRA